MPRIYLDHATTTPPDPRVREAMQPFLGDGFGSPSSVHQRGRQARARVAGARAAVARLLDAAPEDVLFTASATEANNLAIKGVALAAKGRGRILAAATEHLSVLHPLRSLEREGFEVALLPVDSEGAVDRDRLAAELAGGALLLSVAHASAEIGTIQAVDELARLASEHGVPFHCDASVTAGLLPWTGVGCRADLVTLTPHLFNGPQGVAALCVRGPRRLKPLIEGGDQEGGLRAGTEPLAAIVGFGVAADLAVQEGPMRASLAERRARDLRQRLAGTLDGVLFTGAPRNRVPGHLSLCIRGVEAEALLRDLDALGIEASSGSACVTSVGKPSHVLEALGIEPVVARGALTLMFGLGNGDGDAALASEGLERAVRRLRAIGPGRINR
jgi:cysteine desulfurase